VAEPRISIITPWCGHPELLADYTEAVAGADEVIVVDNASDAGTAWLLRQAALKSKWSLIRNETNRKFGPAVNQGFRSATGDVWITINNDVKAGNTSGWIEQARRDVKSNGFYGPALLEVTKFGMTFRYIEGWCLAATAMTWRAVSMFDEAAYPEPLWEDTDVCLRARQCGFELVKTNWNLIHKGGTSRRDIEGANDYEQMNQATFLRRLWASDERKLIA
jgi:GT2 family glycosyltransferase